VAQDQQLLPDEVWVLNDPAFERQLIDAALKGDRFERDLRPVGYQQQARGKRFHDLTCTAPLATPPH
jgi:hypothetical protein